MLARAPRCLVRPAACPKPGQKAWFVQALPMEGKRLPLRWAGNRTAHSEMRRARDPPPRTAQTGGPRFGTPAQTDLSPARRPGPASPLARRPGHDSRLDLANRLSVRGGKELGVPDEKRAAVRKEKQNRDQNKEDGRREQKRTVWFHLHHPCRYPIERAAASSELLV